MLIGFGFTVVTPVAVKTDMGRRCYGVIVDPVLLDFHISVSLPEIGKEVQIAFFFVGFVIVVGCDGIMLSVTNDSSVQLV